MSSDRPILSESDLARRDSAFTRVDLLAVLAVVAGLVVIHIAASETNQAKGRTAVCLSNLHRLINAWHLYAEDNNGVLVMNFHGGDALGGAAGNNPANAPWALGWLDWTTSRDNTNIAFLTQDKWSKLSGYLQRSPAVFKCPADHYLSPSQRNKGWTGRVRTVSANIGIGGGNAEAGPWNPIYRHITKVSGFIFPGPSETWVYLDEHPDSINDPAFFNPQASQWIDEPALLHDGATTVAFADSHVEIHRWEASLATPAARRVRYTFSAPLPKAGDADIHWLSYRAGRVSETSF